jgi:hypothetical protein
MWFHVYMPAYYFFKLILLNATMGKIITPTVTELSSPSVLYPHGTQTLLFNCRQSITLLTEYIHFRRFTLQEINSIFSN